MPASIRWVLSRRSVLSKLGKGYASWRVARTIYSPWWEGILYQHYVVVAWICYRSVYGVVGKSIRGYYIMVGDS